MKNTLTALLLFTAIFFNLRTFGQTLISNPASRHFCSGVTGVQLSLTTTVAGQNYQLRRVAPAAVMSTLVGNGGPMTFPGLFGAASYATTTLQPTLLLSCRIRFLRCIQLRQQTTVLFAIIHQQPGSKYGYRFRGELIMS